MPPKNKTATAMRTTAPIWPTGDCGQNVPLVPWRSRSDAPRKIATSVHASPATTATRINNPITLMRLTVHVQEEPVPQNLDELITMRHPALPADQTVITSVRWFAAIHAPNGWVEVKSSAAKAAVESITPTVGAPTSKEDTP